jgi:hypothetical protein
VTEPIDVDALMTELRRRVADKKARGLYTLDAVARDDAEGTEPFGLLELERLRELGVVSVHVDSAASTKPVLGPVVTKGKKALVRGTSQPVHAMASDLTAFHGAVLGYLTALGRQVAVLAARSEETAATLAALRDELGSVRRLAEGRHVAAGSAPEAPAATPADRARWAGYAAELGPHPLVIGPAAVAVAAELGAFGAAGDPVGLVRALAPASVRSALVVGAVERLGTPDLTALAAGLARALIAGGLVIVEGANPAAAPPAAAAGWEHRALAPEALARLLEASGFSPVETGWAEAPAADGPAPTYVVRARR